MRGPDAETKCNPDQNRQTITSGEGFRLVPLPTLSRGVRVVQAKTNNFILARAAHLRDDDKNPRKKVLESNFNSKILSASPFSHGRLLRLRDATENLMCHSPQPRVSHTTHIVLRSARLNRFPFPNAPHSSSRWPLLLRGRRHSRGFFPF